MDLRAMYREEKKQLKQRYKKYLSKQIEQAVQQHPGRVVRIGTSGRYSISNYSDFMPATMVLSKEERQQKPELLVCHDFGGSVSELSLELLFDLVENLRQGRLKTFRYRQYTKLIEQSIEARQEDIRRMNEEDDYMGQSFNEVWE